MPYVAPLRHAVLHCAGRGIPFSARSLGALGSLTKPSRASAYAETLVRAGVLRYAGRSPAGEQLYDRSRRFRGWSQRHPRTKPGGNRVQTYRAITLPER